MPTPNFMLEDLSGSLRAVYLLPLFILVPGYTIAWLCDLFDFRRRTGPFRLALSIPLSIGVCPIVTYLLGRISMDAVWAFYWAAALGFAAIQIVTLHGGGRLGFGFSKEMRVFGAIVGAWLVISLGSLIDLQLDGRLYYPTSALDNSVRSAFVHSISTTGIPPQNPFFQPPQPVALRYHYFWLMMCSLVERTGNGSVTPRQALAAGTFWCGVGLLALVALYLRLFSPGDPSRFRRRTLIAALLLAITGLDIIPTLFLLILYARGALGFLLPSVEWWNEHVDWFIYTALWAPHALSSLIAGLTAFLLLWKIPETTSKGGLLRYALPAGMALASCVGASIYVSFVFAAFLVVWTVITLWKRWRRESAGLLVAGAAAAALVSPYLMGLREPAAAGFKGASPIELTVRAFSFAALIPHFRGMSETVRLLLVNLPLVPINYFMELGLFFVVGTFQWRKFRRRGGPLSRQELACVTMIATSILICTFLRSSVIGCNDLGWRGFLLAQFMLLLWAVDIVSERNAPDFLTAPQRRMLVAFLILGGMGTLYDLSLTRLYPVLADRGVVPPLDWMSPDREFGERTYASRSAYQWAQSMTPESALIQFNPKVIFQDTPAMLYSNRRIVAADMQCNAAFGGDPRLCAPILSRIEEIYPASGQTPPGSLRDVCLNLPIDLVVAKDTDAVWKNQASWVWTGKPVFANRYLRMFSCGDSGGELKAAR